MSFDYFIVEYGNGDWYGNVNIVDILAIVHASKGLLWPVRIRKNSLKGMEKRLTFDLPNYLFMIWHARYVVGNLLQTSFVLRCMSAAFLRLDMGHMSESV
jgi:hypothetical protein